MALLVRRSILKKVLVRVSCLLVCIAIPRAWAQHPAGHPTVGTVRPSPPPIFRVPVSAPLVTHGPIAPRIPTAMSARTIGTTGFRPPWRPIRPFPKVFILYESPFFFGGPSWGWNSCWWTSCDLFWPWSLGYTTVSSPGPTSYVAQAYETPVYAYGEERPDLPQLFLQDGTILNVTDYWVIDGQLHFTMIDDEGAKPAEHAIPFDALDLQTTVDANTRKGFRFMLRNEPVEQYLRDHPEGPPAAVTPRPQ